MAKGGYQRQRLQAKKEAERKARKRARRNKVALQWGIGIAVLALLGTVLGVTLTGGKKKPVANPSASPTASASSSASSTACTKSGRSTVGKKAFASAPCFTIDQNKNYTATLTTSLGVIKIKLFPKEAPRTVNNFVFLANNKFYDGSIFHRVIPGFGEPTTNMIQGGDAAAGDGSGGPGYTFGDENMIAFSKPGYLAMANSGPGTNGSQFFILSGPVTHLNVPGTCPGPQACHSVFGQVTSGLDIVSKIAKVKTDSSTNKPLTPVVLKSVVITVG